MASDKLRGILLSDFNIQNLAGYLNNNPDEPGVEVKEAPFGQVIPLLVDPNAEIWQKNYDFAVIWTQPESVVPSFQKALNFESVNMTTILGQVDEYTLLLKNIRDKVKTLFVPSWVLPTYHRGWGLLDSKSGFGTCDILMQMNIRLSHNLDDVGHYYVLNTRKWTENSGKAAFNPKMYYMGKIAFANPVFVEAMNDVKAALRAVSGLSKKLIILDLDDTLWGGIVGDLGWENIRLGGHDPTGEAFVDFQKALKSFTNRGLLLGIVSKNEEDIAFDAINKHPEMALRQDDFAGWRINWQDKAQNIVDLVRDLNLGLQSVVFIDDNPVERARVREALPEVLVPEWPADKMLYKSSLLSLNCFDTPGVSQEDLARSKMYVSERKRKDLKDEVSSLNDWLATLEMKVEVNELNAVDLSRTAQLLNKTNQMNLSTRRMTEQELLDWAGQPGRKLWTFRVFDKFGDSGLTGIASINIKNKEARIVDFVLSCRVMGRKVEETMLFTVCDFAASAGLEKVTAKYLPTHKNNPCLQFFKDSGLKATTGDLFTWDVKNPYPLPPHINLIKNNGKTDDLP
ncbi:HAD-IIIC family phosphatase [candidate division KSB1 bacterium]|nr:HAD-IIIC family phosphatase [candidate division KSB1 bacterium]